MHDDEKPADNSSGRNIRVELTYPGNEHCPSHTTEESAYVGINSSPC